jgi:hypothetical protein
MAGPKNFANDFENSRKLIRTINSLFKNTVKENNAWYKIVFFSQDFMYKSNWATQSNQFIEIKFEFNIIANRRVQFFVTYFIKILNT